MARSGARPVVVGEGQAAPFSTDHFAGTLIRLGLSPDAAFRGASMLDGILAGSGAEAVTTLSLRAITSELLSHPVQPDPGAMRRLLSPVPAASPQPRTTAGMPDLFANVVKAASPEHRPERLELVGMGYLQANVNHCDTVEQYLAFGRTAKGTLMEFADGPMRAVKALGEVPLRDVLPAHGAELRPISEVLANLEPLHPYWSSSLSGPFIRVVNLSSFQPGVVGRFSPYTNTTPIYTVVTAVPGGGIIASVDAITGALLTQVLVPLEALLLPASVFASLSALDLIIKLVGLAATVIAVIATATGGTLGALTGIVAILAAFGLALEIVTIGLLLSRILLELFPDNAKARALNRRFNDLRERLEKATSDIGDGRLSGEEARKELREITQDLDKLKDEVKEAITEGGSEVDKMGEGVDAMGKATSELSKLLGGH